MNSCISSLSRIHLVTNLFEKAKVTGCGHGRGRRLAGSPTQFKRVCFSACVLSSLLKGAPNTPNASMADHSVIARDEFHESEASEASVFCFDNASPEKSCFVEGLVCLISLCLRVFEFLNATRSE